MPQRYSKFYIPNQNLYFLRLALTETTSGAREGSSEFTEATSGVKEATARVKERTGGLQELPPESKNAPPE